MGAILSLLLSNSRLSAADEAPAEPGIQPAAATAATAAELAGPAIPVVPLPAEWHLQEGHFEWSPATYVAVIGSGDEVSSLRTYVSRVLGMAVAEEPGAIKAKTVVRLTLRRDRSELGSEGYWIGVTPEQIRIEAPTPAGLFYGFQTLRQLLPSDVARKHSAVVLCLTITDRPRYRWRGFMFDSGYTFWSVPTVKRYLDRLAYYKFNVMHWHLTETWGWRVEIKEYPKLTDQANFMHMTGRNEREYYTQEELKDIVRYARERHIRIIPEIESPGHALAALKAYPELSCGGKPTGTFDGGLSEDAFCGAEVIRIDRHAYYRLTVPDYKTEAAYTIGGRAKTPLPSTISVKVTMFMALDAVDAGNLNTAQTRLAVALHEMRDGFPVHR